MFGLNFMWNSCIDNTVFLMCWILISPTVKTSLCPVFPLLVLQFTTVPYVCDRLTLLKMNWLNWLPHTFEAALTDKMHSLSLCRRPEPKAMAPPDIVTGDLNVGNYPEFVPGYRLTPADQFLWLNWLNESIFRCHFQTSKSFLLDHL